MNRHLSRHTRVSRAGRMAMAGVFVVGLLWSRAALADQGQDFIAEARLLYRAVACGDDSPVPAGLDARVVAAHCKDQLKRVERLRKRYVEPATAFFAKHRPGSLPDRVVYPFGGGDLLSALVTYPDAREITTMSLEHAGDPRRLAKLDKKQLAESLSLYRDTVYGLLVHHDSASENLRKMEQGAIPGQLAFFLQGLAALGYEPVSLKFFRFEEDGSLHYYSAAEIAELDSTVARKKSVRWVDTDFSVAFTNSEITFRRRGAPASEPVRVHRHIAFNLNDQGFPNSPLHRHLLAKGKVVALTKAASYLLWTNNFKGIRNYLLDNMEIMISDSTGIPPLYARKAGFEQETFGTYTGAYLEAKDKHDEDFVALWAEQPKRRLRFRYGYPDAAKHYHLLITRKAGGKSAKK